MDADRAREQIFGDALACEETRPAVFLPGTLGRAALRQAVAQSENLLRSLAVVEDSRSDDAEEHGPNELALNRIEAKLDLLTALVASKMGEHRDPLQALQWSALGVCVEFDQDLDMAPDSEGAFRIQPSDWLPETITLPARVLATSRISDAKQLWLGFGPLSPGLKSALERHLFRVHRRAIAESRRPR